MKLPATTLAEAKLVLDRQRRALNPTTSAEDRRLYVTRETETHELLISKAETAAVNKRPFRWFFTGHTGAGKSTELNRIIGDARVQRFYHPHLFSVRQHLDVSNLDFSDLILGIAKSVTTIAKDEGVHVPKELLKQMAKWGAETEFETEFAVSGEGKAGFEFDYWIGKAALEVQAGGEKRKTVREKLRDSLTDFINLIDGLVAAIQKQIKKKVLVVIDTLDHVDHRPVQEIFTNHWASLDRLSVSLLIVVPLPMHLELQFMAAVQSNISILPNIKVFKGPGLEELDANGFKFFRNLIRPLADLTLFSDEALAELFRLSGGILRDMLGMAGDACMYGAIDQAEHIDLRHVRRVLDDRKAFYRRLLTNADYKILAEVRSNPHPPVVEGVGSLLHLKAIIFDANGEGWFYLNPAVEAILVGDSTVRQKGSTARPVAPQPLLIERIRLENVRCFSHIELSFGGENATSLWNMIVGDNSSGKSTLLRCIALGLCHERHCLSLLTKLPGRFIRQGATQAEIQLTLWSPESRRRFVVTTIVSADSSESKHVEIVRKHVQPEDGFRWDEVFACAYSANRGNRTSQSYESYTFIDAVRTLFDTDASLMNPEVVLLREEPAVRRQLEAKLLQVLMLDDPTHSVISDSNGISIRGPWGTLPLESLSDGYRSTTHWIADFVGWAIMAGRFGKSQEIGGVLLIDELEQHLHPRWQRFIVSRLSRQFPGTQIISTTHTPLVASGLADVERATLTKLARSDSNQVTTTNIDPRSLRGKRADQILTSDLFGLLTTRNPKSLDEFHRFQELDSRPRTPEEEKEWKDLRDRIDRSLTFGENPYEQEVERAVAEVLEQRLKQPPTAPMTLEIKRQLQNLFRGQVADDQD